MQSRPPLSLDLDKFRLPKKHHKTKSLACTPKGQAKFLSGPIPWHILQTVCALPGKCLPVFLTTWLLYKLNKRDTFPLDNQLLTLAGVSRYSKYRALKQLQGAGLMLAHTKVGASPIITITAKLTEAERSSKYLAGPLPWDWIETAASLPGKSTHVLLVAWFQYKVGVSPHIKLSRKYLGELGVTAQASNRGVRALEKAGLLTVTRKRGRLPRAYLVSIETSGGP